MNIDEITRLLTSRGITDDWEITSAFPLHPMKPIYRFKGDEHDYCVKVIKDNEKRALQRLVPLNLRHVQRFIAPSLLDKNVLVTEYLPHGTLSELNISPDLIREYAELQNTFNKKPYIDDLDLDIDENGFLRGDPVNGFYIKAIKPSFEIGYQNLKQSIAMHNPAFSDECRAIADYIMKHKEAISYEYATMPYAYLHNDFRVDNISDSDPQYIIDWGSCWGWGPFIFDVAPVLLNDKRNLQVYTKTSDICRESDSSQIHRWIVVAACARFIYRFRWNTPDLDIDETTRKGLDTIWARMYQYYTRILEEHLLSGDII